MTQEQWLQSKGFVLSGAVWKLGDIEIERCGEDDWLCDLGLTLGLGGLRAEPRGRACTPRLALRDLMESCTLMAERDRARAERLDSAACDLAKVLK